MAAKEAGNIDRRFGRWPAGVDQVSDVRDLQAREQPGVRAAVNIDFGTDGRPHRRAGYIGLRTGSPAHSLWAPRDAQYGFVVQDGVFYRVTMPPGGPEQFEAVVSLPGRKKLAYAELAGSIYVSNPSARFVVGAEGPARPWGVEVPGGQPQATAASSGALDAGRYQVTFTYISNAGEESGAATPIVLEVPDGGGIQLDGIPQPASQAVVAIRPYLSGPNGLELVATKTIPVGTASLLLGRHSLNTAGKPLDTLHMQRVPFCRLLVPYRGRLYFVPAQGDGARLYYTEPLRYGLYRPHLNYLPLPGRIEDAVAVNGGLYVGTDRATFYFGGEDPKSMQRQQVAPNGMVAGTAIAVRGQIFGDGAANDDVGVWWSTAGELIRGSGGVSLVTLTRGRLGLPRYVAGATLAREFDGLSQIVSSLRGADEPSSVGARDRAVARVFRNGIEI